MNSDSRYIIGIDLGTSNTSISYVDTQDENPLPKSLEIPQVNELGEIKKMASLPSALYLPSNANLKENSLDLPWSEAGLTFSVGSYARKVAQKQADAVVTSAKSWLCNPAVDRHSAILPFGAEDRKMSPIEASMLFLGHLAEYWDFTFAQEDETLQIYNQQVILTVPASFDAVARQLTVEAAEAAGMNATLLEEPQAAFYNWLQENDNLWRDEISAGESILVCDIGGGTSDFSLISVRDRDGELELHRQAVGNHILLGGDNMDLTLAYAMQQKLRQRLNRTQMLALTHACREAKERKFADPSIESQSLTILGSGSSLIGSALKVELTRAEFEQYLVEGFFPECELTDGVKKRDAAALRSFGLPYENDTALTRHLAEFISKNCQNGTALPKHILFNGGVSKSTLFRERVLNMLQLWSGEDVVALSGTSPDLAVAQGAAWFGYVKRGHAIRIQAGSPYSYYLGIESSMPAIPGFPPPLDAVCIVPQGCEEGNKTNIPMDNLGLMVGEEASFRFFSSNNHADHHVGTVIDDFSIDELTEMPSMKVLLTDKEGRDGNLLPVKVTAGLSDIGTLEVACHEIGGNGEWKLEFDLSEDQ